MLSIELSQLLQAILKDIDDAKVPYKLIIDLAMRYPRVADTATAVLSREVTKKNTEATINDLEPLIDQIMKNTVSQYV
jgi:hypothetical protein